MSNISKFALDDPSGLFRIGILSLLLAYSGLTCGNPVIEAEIVAPPLPRQAKLTHLVRQDCGSCHDLHVEGGPDVPLTPTALKGKSAEALKDAILYGRNGTAMPPWNSFLTEAEARWIVQMLQEGLF